MGLTYINSSLFEAPKGSILVHACNAQGVWGAGIAKIFFDKYPNAFNEYQNHCRYHDEPMMFPAVITDYDNGHRIGCLLTSNRFGSRVDDPDLILKNTERALDYFLELYNRDTPAVIYSNKFNSGLFNVAWEKTEAILKKFIKQNDLEWIVCTYG